LGGELSSAPGRGVFYKSAWVFYLILAIAGILWLGASRGTLELEIFLALDHLLRDLGLGVGAAAVLIGLWLSGRRFVPAMAELERQLASVIGPLEPDEVVALALISGFAEELFFRGAMLASWGFWVSSLIFGLVHSGRGVFRYWTLFALVAGFLFGQLVLLTETLFPAIVAHVLVNGINLSRLSRLGNPDAVGG
jgi:membrane protease YdiL (CAAX protease family)